MEYITVSELCEICEIEMDFLKDLAQFGLIEIVVREKKECICKDELECIKMIKRLFFTLGVNREGIEIILSMRNKILELQTEVDSLKRKVNCLTKEQEFRNIGIILEQNLMFDI